MLLDHFHPPLSDQRNWKGFHNEWATYLSADLNRCLPLEWFATTEVDFGVEIDVAAIEETHPSAGVATVGSATFLSDISGWRPTAPRLSLALPVISDIVEVQIYHSSGGRALVGAIELVSPRIKDRAESRQAFVAKCESLLVAGVGLIVVDVVSDRHADMHRDLLERFATDVDLGDRRQLYAAAYHPVQRDDGPAVDVWHEPLSIGGELPALPLFLRGGPCVRVDLARSYQRTCAEQRIPQT